MVKLANKKECTGCAACMNACPVSCIEMKENVTGFLYPVVNNDKCINCHKCEKACPVIKERRDNKPPEQAHHIIVQNKDREVLRTSTSGGLFTALGKVIISEQQGVVFGAEFTEGYSVGHTYVEKTEDLARFRSSKYVQSEIGNAFKQAKDFLDTGRWVIFSGTPCQINGLYGYLGKDYNNLITVDVMCRAVPSPKILRKYIDLCNQRFSKINKFVFRDKGLGYSYSTVAVYGKDRKGKNKIYRRGIESDEWLRVFFKRYCYRESCYDCMFQSGERAADITMWDCFQVYKLAPKLDNNLGATNVIFWNEKAERLFEKAKQYLEYQEIQYNPKMGNLYRKSAKKPDIDRNQFFVDADILSTNEFWNKYAPNSVKIKAKAVLRKASVEVHLHDTFRKVIHNLREIKRKRK